MKPLFLAAAAVIVIAASLAGCRTPEPTPLPECAVLVSIANGSSSAPLEAAVVELSKFLAGRPCAESYGKYAEIIGRVDPPLNDDELRYIAGQLAWSCRIDVPENGCTGPMYASPPVDPGGHVVDLLDASVPNLYPEPSPTGALKELRGWTVVPDGPIAPGSPRCYSAGNPDRPTNAAGMPDWGLVPPVDPATAASGMLPRLPSNAVPANPPNPYRILTPDGLYGWQVQPSPDKCYFVTITRNNVVRYSPPVGVWQNQPVTDLHHCWPRNAWYSDINEPCP